MSTLILPTTTTLPIPPLPAPALHRSVF
jgi:hypothetical protein